MAEQVHEFRARARRDYQQSARQNFVTSSRERQTQKGELVPKKVEGQKMALKSLVTVLNNLVAQKITLDKR